jgi:hypothetical protein
VGEYLESPETIIKIVWSLIGSLGVMALGLLSWGIKRLISASFENTIQIRILNGKIADIIGAIGKISKMEQDINHAHKKIREIENGDN